MPNSLQHEAERDGLTNAFGEGGVGDEAGRAGAPVAAHCVQAVSIVTHALQLAFILICQ